MGCSVSCQIFETFSSSLQWIMQIKLSVLHMSHILDDFICFSPVTSPKCKTYLETFFSLTTSLNIPIKQKKTSQPTMCAVLHGIEVDTVAMSLHLPDDKLLEARQKVREMAKKKKTSLFDLQSLLGTLNFACPVIFPGRAFLRRLFDLIKGVSNKIHWIRLKPLA